MKTALSLSLVVNLFLVVFLARLGLSGNPDGADVYSPSAQGVASQQPNQFASAESTQTHREVLAELEAQLVPNQISVATNYWRPVGETAIDAQARQQSSSEWMRRELYQRFGDEVYDEPVFASYFFPLGPGFEFLTSAQQLRIKQLQNDAQAERAGVLSGGAPDMAALQRGEEQYQRQLRLMLGEDLSFEFQLRDSRLAQQMRNTSFDWTEHEFREVFAIRLRQQENSSNAGALQMALGLTQSGYEPAIENIMGRDRYLEYLKATDPSYRRLVDQVKASGGNETDAERAYEIYAEYAPRIAQAMQNRNLNQAQSLQSERDSRVTGATGLQLGNGQSRSTQVINPDFIRVQ